MRWQYNLRCLIFISVLLFIFGAFSSHSLPEATSDTLAIVVNILPTQFSVNLTIKGFSLVYPNTIPQPHTRPPTSILFNQYFIRRFCHDHYEACAEQQI